MTGETGPTVSVVRPWGLRGLRPAPTGDAPVYRYDPVRQVALTSGGELWINSEGKTWSSITELDGMASMDFSVDRDGRYYFLESNPAGGQYGWLEAKTGVRLTEAVADLLAQGWSGLS